MKDDRLTLAAIGVLAMMLTTVDHEVIGHGAACLLGGGQVEHVSTTLFACSRPTPWVAAGGPFNDLLMGLLALAIGLAMPARRTGWRLFFTAAMAFSFFWETGYLARAMLSRDGDLYFFARGLLGQPDGVWRIAGIALGAILYLLSIRLTEARLSAILPDAARARAAARTIWLGATVAEITAALVFKGDFWPALRDAALEIGLAAVPLLLIPRRDGSGEASPALARHWSAVALAACIFILFTATVGHGLGTF